eukprot:874419-Amphidinium_carterae.1
MEIPPTEDLWVVHAQNFVCKQDVMSTTSLTMYASGNMATPAWLEMRTGQCLNPPAMKRADLQLRSSPTSRGERYLGT